MWNFNGYWHNPAPSQTNFATYSPAERATRKAAAGILAWSTTSRVLERVFAATNDCAHETVHAAAVEDTHRSCVHHD